MRARLLVNPADFEALLRLATIEFERGEFAPAQKRLEEAVKISPRLVPAWLLLGEIALSANDGPRARVCYERVLAIDPKRTSARIGLGWSSLVSRDAVGAARIWRPLIQDTHDQGTLERMAELFAALGDQVGAAEARAALQRATRRP